MTRAILFFAIVAISINIWAQQINTFIDHRDGKTYKTVEIGRQTWMAENLAYKPNNGNYWVYNNNISNLANFGYLYDWQTARNVCPKGWHLPSDDEWTELTNFVGNNPGIKLKAKSGWGHNGNGSDAYGFSALPGGIRDERGTFHSINFMGIWWSVTAFNTNLAVYRDLRHDISYVGKSSYNKKSGFSVRCVRD